MSIEITVLISAVSVAFAVYFGLKNSKRADTKDIEERVKGDTRINMKLDEIVSDVKDVKSELVSMRQDIKSHNDRLIKVEESCKSAHHRLDSIERRIVDKEVSEHE